MVSKFALLSNLFLVSVALAVPSSQLGARFPPGEDLQLQLSDSSASSVDITFNNGNTPSTWAGAQWRQDTDSFRTISGTFIVPTVNPLHFEGGATFWIGIDSPDNCGVILRIGVHLRVMNGQVLFNALYQWFPEPAQYLPTTSIKPGHAISLTVDAMSSTSGIVIFRNHNESWAISRELTSSHALCKKDAEWIVEGSDQADMPLTNFGRVTFYNAVASGPAGIHFTARGAALLDIQENGRRLTTTSVDTSDEYNVKLTVKYGN